MFYNTPKDGDNLSSDWDKYTTPEETRERLRKQMKFGKTTYKDPNDYFVLSIGASKVREITPQQIIEYDPISNNPEIDGSPNNEAHTIIIGPKNDITIRTDFANRAVWAIAPE